MFWRVDFNQIYLFLPVCKILEIIEPAHKSAALWCNFIRLDKYAKEGILAQIQWLHLHVAGTLDLAKAVYTLLRLDKNHIKLMSPDSIVENAPVRQPRLSQKYEDTLFGMLRIFIDLDIWRYMEAKCATNFTTNGLVQLSDNFYSLTDNLTMYKFNTW